MFFFSQIFSSNGRSVLFSIARYFLLTGNYCWRYSYLALFWWILMRYHPDCLMTTDKYNWDALPCSCCIHVCLLLTLLFLFQLCRRLPLAIELLVSFPCFLKHLFDYDEKFIFPDLFDETVGISLTFPCIICYLVCVLLCPKICSFLSRQVEWNWTSKLRNLSMIRIRFLYHTVGCKLGCMIRIRFLYHTVGCKLISVSYSWL